MDDSQDVSLRQAFDQAKQSQEEIDSLDPRSAAFRHILESAIQTLVTCQRMIKDLSVFSPNEELEDVSTQSLQFLTVDYVLADLLLKSYDDHRLASIQRSAQLLESFLERLDHYNMLSQADRKLYERYQETKPNFSLLSTANADERRKVKISRFQGEKQLKQKLEYLRTHSRDTTADDEAVRSLHLTEIAFNVHQAFQALDMITQESAILAQIQQQAEPTQQNGASTDDRSRQIAGGYSERLDGPATLGGLGRTGGPLLSSSGKPLQPFTLLDKRSDLQKGVFRPGHSLPTMTMDEYLEEERRRGGIIDGGGNANAPEAEPNEDNLELVDAATVKAREWDEFVEANPKGAGNTLNRG